MTSDDQRNDDLSQEPGELDAAYEERLDRVAGEAALLLLRACRALRWGSGDPVTDSIERVERVATAYDGFTRLRPVPRKPRKLGLEVTRAVWDRDGWECGRCGSHRDLTVDHKTPRLLGGTDEMDNLQTLCRSCNSRKGARV